MPQSSGELEHVGLAGNPKVNNRRIHSKLNVGEIVGDILSPEQLVRQSSATDQNLVG